LNWFVAGVARIKDAAGSSSSLADLAATVIADDSQRSFRAPSIVAFLRDNRVIPYLRRDRHRQGCVALTVGLDVRAIMLHRGFGAHDVDAEPLAWGKVGRLNGETRGGVGGRLIDTN
jgi:hypothetical protein